MISNLELSILKGLIYDETFSRKVLPYIKDEYFESTTSRFYFQKSKSYFIEYGCCPSVGTLAVFVEEATGVSQEEHQSIYEALDNLKEKDEANHEWLVNATEEWCKRRAVYLALMESIAIYDGQVKEKAEDSIPGVLSEALAVCFDAHVGHDYLGDYNDRYEFYHEKQERLSFGLSYFDKITKGGLPNKTLNVALAGTGVGKSLFMCSIASNMLMAGKNVLYITMEMAEERIAERIDANLLNTNIQDLIEVPRPMFETKVTGIQKKTRGQLFIKEYPTASAHAGHFDALLKELSLKKSFRPDIIFIDYLNICCSTRYSGNSNINSYTVVKAIAEELRGLAVKYNVPVVSATQTTRSGFSSSDVTLTDTSESFGLPATADFMFALISNDDLEGMGQIMVKQLKNRYNDPTVHRKFVVGIDRAKMRLFDVEQTAQDDVLDKEPTFKYNEEPKFTTNKFSDFTF